MRAPGVGLAAIAAARERDQDLCGNEAGLAVLLDLQTRDELLAVQLEDLGQALLVLWPAVVALQRLLVVVGRISSLFGVCWCHRNPFQHEMPGLDGSRPPSIDASRPNRNFRPHHWAIVKRQAGDPVSVVLGRSCVQDDLQLCRDCSHRSVSRAKQR